MLVVPGIDEVHTSDEPEERLSLVSYQLYSCR